MIVQKKEENIKRSKVKSRKPYVYEKMMKFSEKINRGESIAILQFQYRYTCNFKCVHCSIKRLQHLYEKQMSITDVRGLSKQADRLGLARFVITGGEPLVFHDFDDLVKAINPDKFYINVDTNGWLLDYNRASHLYDIGIDRIQLSIDSLNEREHDEFRQVKGAFKRAMQAVDASLKVGLDIFIQTVVTRSRLYSKEFTDFVEYFNDMGIGVFVTFAKPVGAWENKFDDLIGEKDLAYFRKLEKEHKLFSHLTPAYGLKGGCAGCRNIVSILATGDIQPCPYFHCSMGNIYEESLSDILARCMSLKPFKSDTCLLAADRDFIDKYLAKNIYGKPLPVKWQEVFCEDDFES